MVELVEPAHLWVPEHPESLGAEVVGLADAIGLPLDPEQELALDAMYSLRPDGRLVALEFVVVAPRQNIKTHLFKAAAWADLLLFDQNLVVWTAHEFNTAMEAFRDMCALVEGSPLISKRVKKIVNANGDEGIEFMSGQRLRFKARTKGGGRGITGDRVFLDESFALQPAHLGSLLPTMAARSQTGDPQIRYGSSAGLMASAMLRNLRDRGRARNDPGLIYVEWCAPPRPCQTPTCTHVYGSTGCVLDDRELWQMANLAMGRRIDPEFIAAMRRSLPAEEFAREFLGWWDEPADIRSGIDLALWALRGATDNPTEPVALALDATPGLTSASIGTYGDIAYIAEHGPGTAWVPSKLLSLHRSKKVSGLGVDAASPAAALIPDLERPESEGGCGFTIRSKTNPHGEIVLLTGREMSTACELITAGVLDGRFKHRQQHALTAAVEGAYQRQSGDTRKWSRRDSTTDISPLVATTIAYFLWTQTGSGPSVYEERGLVTL